MELRINVDINQIINLIHQLPEQEIEKLYSTLQTELSIKKKNGKKNMNELIVSAPTWSDSDFEEYNEVRSQINKTRLE
ncbi:MAG: hypothetical protein COS14_01345 [Bacteroidetes bacterium CG02_land_8_20_14_3_00_31_25]|nr:MAG: hypothetical protein COS14_01345 [Bacteroidetes bacterium CG02_land_8_20_14_3_00_31_25]